MPSHMMLLSPCLHQLPKLHYGLKDKVEHRPVTAAMWNSWQLTALSQHRMMCAVCFLSLSKIALV